MIYNLYIFDKKGKLLYYSEWNRVKKSGMSLEEEAKLMYGMLYSIKSFVTKISPYDFKQGFTSYKTNKYALNYYETTTGVKFVINTDTAATNVRELLTHLYNTVYLNYVVKNPLCSTEESIQSNLFKAKVDSFIKQSACFST